MTTSAISKALIAAPFFKDFSQFEINEISKISKLKSLKSGEIVFSEFTPAKSMFLLNKGHIKLIFDNKTIIEVAKGQIFGDWAIVNHSVRLATAKSVIESEVIEINATAIQSFQLDPKIGYKITLQIANSLVNRMLLRSQIASHILIEEGENQYTEFKSSLRWNEFKSDKDAAIELATLKTIAGFLNAHGGVLFIGVKDDGSILGISHDRFENPDKMMLHLTHLVTQRLGKEALRDVHISVVKIDNKLVLRVDCDASHQPIFVKNKTEDLFFVRVGNMTQSYRLKDTVEYIKQRF